jgi:hypothetical protein
MSSQNGPRDLESVLASRYWLTEAGWAATEPQPPHLQLVPTEEETP